MSPDLKLDATTAVVFGEVDPDRYLVTVESFMDPKASKSSGDHFVTAQCLIVEGLNSGEKFKGQRLFQNLMIEGKGAGFFIDFWNKCFPKNKEKHLEAGEVIEVNTDEMIGQQLYIVCESQEFPPSSGEFRTQPTRVLPVI